MRLKKQECNKCFENIHSTYDMTTFCCFFEFICHTKIMYSQCALNISDKPCRKSLETKRDYECFTVLWYSVLNSTNLTNFFLQSAITNIYYHFGFHRKAQSFHFRHQYTDVPLNCGDYLWHRWWNRQRCKVIYSYQHGVYSFNKSYHCSVMTVMTNQFIFSHGMPFVENGPFKAD